MIHLLKVELSVAVLALVLPAAGPTQTARQPRAPGARSSDFDGAARRAAEARRAGQLPQAISAYREALRLRPSWDEGWWYLGTLNYDLDAYSEARDAFRKFVTLKPEGGPSWAFLGFCEYRLKDYDLALEHVQRALQLGLAANEELHTVTRYHAAILLIRVGEFDHAFESLTVLARKADDNPKVIEAMGLDVLQMALLPAEIPAEKRELVLKAGRAGYADAASRPIDARQHYKELLERWPDTPNVHYAYGVFLLDAQPEAALAELRRELEISPGHVLARLQLAFELLMRGDYDAALPYAEEAVLRAPGLFKAHLALGRILLAKGQTERAVAELEAARLGGPGSPEAHFALSRAYAAAGRGTEAEKELSVFRELEEARRAVKSAENDVRFKPDSAEARLALARAYEKAGRKSDAQREYAFHRQLLARQGAAGKTGDPAKKPPKETP
jgi:tetratricopeptide (TPR) repeat protein